MLDRVRSMRGGGSFLLAVLGLEQRHRADHRSVVAALMVAALVAAAQMLQRMDSPL
jgi:hypothetical protein